jgi:hypothetical protein
VNIAAPQLLVWGHQITGEEGKEHEEELHVKHGYIFHNLVSGV